LKINKPPGRPFSGYGLKKMFGKPYCSVTQCTKFYNLGYESRTQNEEEVYIFRLHTTGAKHREWIGMGVAGIIIDSYCGSFPGWWFET